MTPNGQIAIPLDKAAISLWPAPSARVLFWLFQSASAYPAPEPCSLP